MSGGVDAEIQLAEGEEKLLLVDEQLNCVVNGEGPGENPNYCRATRNDSDQSSLCVGAQSNDDVPEHLKDIEKIDAEGMYVNLC